MGMKISSLCMVLISNCLFGRPDPARDMEWTQPNSLNLYQYTQNNPVSNQDPFGLEWYRMQSYDEEGDETGMAWPFIEDTPEIQQIQVTQDDDGNTVEQIVTIKGETELLTFDGASLNWHKEDGLTESWAAVSGNLDSMGRTQPDEQWVSIVGRGQWPGGTNSWGAYRVPLEPSQVTDPVSGVTRTNFFLHGGSTPGSRGCIDLRGGDKTFFPKFLANTTQMLRNKNLKMKLEIEYPKVGKPAVPAW